MNPDPNFTEETDWEVDGARDKFDEQSVTEAMLARGHMPKNTNNAWKKKQKKYVVSLTPIGIVSREQCYLLQDSLICFRYFSYLHAAQL